MMLGGNIKMVSGKQCCGLCDENLQFAQMVYFFIFYIFLIKILVIDSGYISRAARFLVCAPLYSVGSWSSKGCT
jgi:hypothetical protein